MLLRYILFFVLIGAFLRFLDSMVKLGRRGSDGATSTGSGHGMGGKMEGRDVSDAEYEILPDEPETPES